MVMNMREVSVKKKGDWPGKERNKRSCEEGNWNALHMSIKLSKNKTD